STGSPRRSRATVLRITWRPCSGVHYCSSGEGNIRPRIQIAIVSHLLPGADASLQHAAVAKARVHPNVNPVEHVFGIAEVGSQRDEVVHLSEGHPLVVQPAERAPARRAEV